MSAADVFDLLGEKIVEQQPKAKPVPAKPVIVRSETEIVRPHRPYTAVRLDKLTTLIINDDCRQQFS